MLKPLINFTLICPFQELKRPVFPSLLKADELSKRERSLSLDEPIVALAMLSSLAQFPIRA